ncbi:MAG: class I SAM-dependent methyltransferase [Caldisericia bacterium]|nr:class I SAM-dependent methyltransferase [Caldisericia bacterium]
MMGVIPNRFTYIDICVTLAFVDWTDSYFDTYYAEAFLEDVDQKRTKAQVDMIINCFGFEPPIQIADIGCGLGRHTIEFARRGYVVQGFDSNAEYLKKASEIAAEQEVKNTFFIQKDMREFDMKEMFDALISVWISFGYFDDETNADIFSRMVRSIKPGGNIFIDIENRDYILSHFQPQSWKMKDDTLILERSKFDHNRSVNLCKRTILKRGKKKTTKREIRLYSPHEIMALAHSEDLYNINLLGDWDGNPYSIRSPRLILTARVGI